MARAKITIHECIDYSWFDRKILGWRWWWKVVTPNCNVRMGFAPSREKALDRAHKAARKLADKPHAPFEELTYDIPEVG